MSTRRKRRTRKASSAATRRLFRRIVLAVDGSKSSQHATKAAMQIARNSRAELIVTSVVQPPNYMYSPNLVAPAPAPGLAPMLPLPVYREGTKRAERLVERTARTKEKIKVKKKVLKAEASVAGAITDYAAAQKADLIVVGTSSVGGLKRFVLGSVSNSVVNNAKTSVLVVR